MKIIKKLFLLMTLVVLTVGCTVSPQTNEENINTVQSTILEKMANQKHYTFQGKTSVTLSEKMMEDVVQFNGFIHNKDNMYMDLSIASIEGMPEEKMQFIQYPDKMMVKYSKGEEWEQIGTQDQTLFYELKNWNPEFFLTMIAKNSIHTERLDKKESSEGLLIQLNQKSMKELIVNQLRNVLNGGLSEEEMKEMKENLGLTDEEITQMREELDKQLQATEEQIDEMVNTMDVEASFTVYYDPANMLIQQIVQHINTNYQLQGEEFQEMMIVDIQFSNYGEERTLPI